MKGTTREHSHRETETRQESAETNFTDLIILPTKKSLEMSVSAGLEKSLHLMFFFFFLPFLVSEMRKRIPTMDLSWKYFSLICF